MTTAKRLKPKPPPNGRLQHWQQCEMTLEEMSPGSKGWTRSDGTNWRVQRYTAMGLDPHRCTLGQAVEINGRKLCTKHAGQIALAILLGEST